MASVLVGRQATKLLSNRTFDYALLGVGAFVVYEFWDEFKALFEVSKDIGEGVGTAFESVGSLVNEGAGLVDKGLEGIGELAGASDGDAKEEGIGVVESSIIGSTLIGGLLEDFGILGGKDKETDLQKRIDKYNLDNGVQLPTNDEAARDLWSYVIEKEMSFKEAGITHIKSMRKLFPKIKYDIQVSPTQESIGTLRFDDDTPIWTAYHGISYICRRHQSDVFVRPTNNGERQRFISDALIAEAIPSPDYFKDYQSESNMVTYNNVSKVYISPRWHFQPA